MNTRKKWPENYSKQTYFKNLFFFFSFFPQPCPIPLSIFPFSRCSISVFSSSFSFTASFLLPTHSPYLAAQRQEGHEPGRHCRHRGCQSGLRRDGSAGPESGSPSRRPGRRQRGAEPVLQHDANRRQEIKTFPFSRRKNNTLTEKKNMLLVRAF